MFLWVVCVVVVIVEMCTGMCIGSMAFLVTVVVFRVLWILRSKGPKGAKEEEIEGLAKKIWTKADGSEKSDDNMCSICYCDYEEGNELRVLPCDHHFHKDCVDQWLKVNKTCPLCRQDIVPKSSPSSSHQSQREEAMDKKKKKKKKKVFCVFDHVQCLDPPVSDLSIV
jgi:hypothetical protein